MKTSEKEFNFYQLKELMNKHYGRCSNYTAGYTFMVDERTIKRNEGIISQKGDK